MNDYNFVMLAEQMKGGDATAQGPAADKLAKLLASKEAIKHINKMRQNKMPEASCVLPAKSFCKQFFESFPAYYKWSALYAKQDR